MSGEERVTTVTSEVTGTPGRSINHARTNHLVVDEPQWAGGPGEAVSPEESFLTGVSACGVSLVESFADERGYSLSHVEAKITGIREKDDPSDYKRIEMNFTLEGVSRPRAEELVEAYKNR